MGLSLKVAAERFSNDSFIPWLADTDTFDVDNPIKGRLFAADRFTPIYHRPSSRKFATLQTDAIPDSYVVKRDLTGEIYLVSEILHTEMLQNDRIYDRLRVMHSVSNPSGAKASYHAAAVSGTGDDLGFVSLATAVDCYLDTELHSIIDERETESASLSRFLVTHSANVAPEPGDYLQIGSDYHLVLTAYSDGGFHNARTIRQPVAYVDVVYSRYMGTGGYNPTTGVVTQATTDYNVSGLVGDHISTGLSSSNDPVDRTLTFYIFFRHIGITPKLGDTITYDGTSYIITTVSPQHNSQQWQLVCKAN